MQWSETAPLRVLLVDRDREELLRVQRLLETTATGSRFVLHWVRGADGVIEALGVRPYDVCVVAERTVGARLQDVLDCVAEANGGTPLVLLTERGIDPSVALQQGVACALCKSGIDGPKLVHAIRVAFERSRAPGETPPPERQFRAVFDGALDAMLIADEQGRYIEGNPAALSLLGVDAQTLCQMSVADVVVKQESREVGSQWASFLKEGHLEGEVVLRRADGSLRTAEFRATANIMPGLHLSVLRDLTERRCTEERLALSERMACVGTMAAGLAHEINNPLTTVMTKLELAERALAELTREHAPSAPFAPALDWVREQLSGAHDAAVRIGGIVRDIKLFSRASDDRDGPIDLHEVLEATLRTAGNELRHRAKVVKHYGSIPPVLGNESRLGQVFLNLIVNAIQAMPEGKVERNELRISSWFDLASDMVMVEIADTGHGMSRETIAQIFMPFFTTKPSGEGLGLGLAICQRLVTALGGQITARSELGQGSAFRVALPVGGLVQKLEPTPEAPRLRARPAPAGTRLLVIDDEASICDAVASFFELEHEVKAVMRASEALALIEGGAQFDVIFCDLMMPEMTGMELHERLQRVAPEAAARIVFWTGGAFTERAREFVAETKNDCIHKPFTLRALKEIVNVKLSARSG